MSMICGHEITKSVQGQKISARRLINRFCSFIQCDSRPSVIVLRLVAFWAFLRFCFRF
jgi:hypothetical protein